MLYVCLHKNVRPARRGIFRTSIILVLTVRRSSLTVSSVSRTAPIATLSFASPASPTIRWSREHASPETASRPLRPRRPPVEASRPTLVDQHKELLNRTGSLVGMVVKEIREVWSSLVVGRLRSKSHLESVLPLFLSASSTAYRPNSARSATLTTSRATATVCLLSCSAATTVLELVSQTAVKGNLALLTGQLPRLLVPQLASLALAMSPALLVWWTTRSSA